MCIGWIRQVRKHLKDIRVEILTEKELPSCVKLEASESKVEVLIKQRLENNMVFPQSIRNKAQHNIFFKMYQLSNINEPFMFIDADAFLLGDINMPLKASEDKPFIAVNHQKVPNHCAHLPYKFLNSGVMVVSDPEFMNFNKLMQTFIDDRSFKYPGTDQAILNSYVRKIKYDYTHPNIGFEWNSCAGYTVFTDKGATSIGLDYEHPVYINHYWHEFKPWNVGCPIYKEIEKELR